MASPTLLLLPLLGLLGLSRAVEDTCPPEDAISPCSCSTYFDGACIVFCTLASLQDLRKVASVDNLCGGNVHFVLVHSKVEGIPAALWKQLLSSRTVDISIKHSALQSLVPEGEKIPKSVTPGEAVIKIDHCSASSWGWSQLDEFYSEGELTMVIDDTPLAQLGSDFSRIASGRVHKVTVDSAGLARLQEDEFAAFRDIRSLSLQNNLLSAVSRSMVARPANRLQFLHFNGNQLTNLPDDLFAEMPALEVVYLRENQFKYLAPELILGVSSKKIRRIDLINNPWECDCKLRSTLQSVDRFSGLNIGKCAAPEDLKGKNVADLQSLLKC